MQTDKTRESCGFLTGLLLHRELGEEPCGVCRLAQESGQWKPLGLTPGQADANRALLDHELAVVNGKKRKARKRPARYGTAESKGYDFPALN